MQEELKKQLLAYLQGELGEEERQEVIRWINESADHRRVYLGMRRRYYFMRWCFRENELDVEAVRKKLRRNWRGRNYLWKRYVAVAASVAVIVSSIFILERGETRKRENVELSKPQAVLVLSSGERICLTKENTRIFEQDSSLVKVDSAGRIEYLENVTDTCEIFNKILVPRGGEYVVTLGDGTRVWLDAESELEYPVKFVSTQRNVRLKGRAYFQVTKERDRSFTVSSGEFQLRVYGTEFNVDVYPEDSVRVVLVDGAVGFKANVSTPEYYLKPGQLGSVNVLTGKVEIRDVNVCPYVAWKNREIVFVDETLETILDELSRWYDVTFFYSRPMLKNIRFSLDIERYGDICSVLSKLEKTELVKFSISGKTVTVQE